MSVTPRTPSTRTSGGLSIPGGVGLSTGEVQEILTRFATLSDVEENLAKMGFPAQREQPNFPLPEITVSVLTKYNNDQYSEVYAQLLAWFNYLVPIHADAKAALLQAQNQLDLVEASTQERLVEQNKNKTKGEGRLTEAEIKNKVLCDPTYQTALLEVQTRKQAFIKLDAYWDIADRGLKVISRQIEVKKIEFGGSNREGNLNRPNYKPIGGR